MEPDEEDFSLFVDASDQEESFLLEVVGPGELIDDEEDEEAANDSDDDDDDDDEFLGEPPCRSPAGERARPVDPQATPCTKPDAVDNDAAVILDERLVERTIRRMQKTSVCLHPKHAHSFQPVHFLLFKSCFVCQKRLPLYSGGSAAAAAAAPASSSSWNAVVRCVACGAVAHRACTTGEGTADANIPVCAVNRSRIEGLNLDDDDDDDDDDDEGIRAEGSSTTADQESRPDSGLEESFECMPAACGPNDDAGAHNDDEKWSRVKTQRGLSPNEIPTIAFPETHHLSSPTSSRPRRHHHVMGNRSSDGGGAETVVEGDQDWDNKSQSSTADGKESDEFNGNVHVSPLHYANHPFASISRALQENVLALHSRLRSGHQLLPRDDVNDDDGKRASSAPLPENPEPPPKEELALSTSGVGLPPVGSVGPIDSGPTLLSPSPPNPIVHLASQTLDLVKSSVAGPAASSAIVAGGAIAGGVAGLALAGPAGAYAGCLGGASALGVILEGGVSIGVLVGSIAVGGYTASQVNASHQVRRNRVLTMGEEGTARKVLLVRSQLPDPDPVWDAIYTEARRSAPDALARAGAGANGNLFPSLVFGKQHAEHEIILERYRRDADILQNTEEEVPTKDKVLLLVSRMLSDKSSLSGFVYRYLMDAFLDRDEERRRQPANFPGVAPATDARTDGSNRNDSSRIRRDDVHAVIRYVTAAVLESRPGLGVTGELAEQSAGAVEALIFGRLYNLVFEEIAQETAEIDESLVTKIHCFHEGSSNRADALSVSEGALEALRLIPQAHSAVDKLYFCVLFLERISDFYLDNAGSNDGDENEHASSGACADSLLKLTCQHVIAARLPAFNAEVAFLEEFARDEQLLRGREGYALVTLQASLHFLNLSDNMTDIFDQENDEENVPVESSSLTSSSSSEVSLSPRESRVGGGDECETPA